LTAKPGDETKAIDTYGAMPTIQVGPGAGLELQEIADIMGRSRKVVVVTGAGISTNCGIPVSGTQTELCFGTPLLTLYRTFGQNMASTP
jgi:hypothetical protein